MITLHAHVCFSEKSHYSKIFSCGSGVQSLYTLLTCVCFSEKKPLDEQGGEVVSADSPHHDTQPLQPPSTEQDPLPPE